ncbi:MAG: hypothetical protein WCC90_03265 [Methylocella sp.]
MVFTSVIRRLEDCNSLIGPFLRFAIHDVAIALPELRKLPIYIPANARHLGVLCGLSHPKERELAIVTNVRKDDVPVAKVGVFVQIVFELA